MVVPAVKLERIMYHVFSKMMMITISITLSGPLKLTLKVDTMTINHRSSCLLWCGGTYIFFSS